MAGDLNLKHTDWGWKKITQMLIVYKNILIICHT